MIITLITFNTQTTSIKISLPRRWCFLCNLSSNPYNLHNLQERKNKNKGLKKQLALPDVITVISSLSCNLNDDFR